MRAFSLLICRAWPLHAALFYPRSEPTSTTPGQLFNYNGTLSTF